MNIYHFRADISWQSLEDGISSTCKRKKERKKPPHSEYYVWQAELYIAMNSEYAIQTAWRWEPTSLRIAQKKKNDSTRPTYFRL